MLHFSTLERPLVVDLLTSYLLRGAGTPLCLNLYLNMFRLLKLKVYATIHYNLWMTAELCWTPTLPKIKCIYLFLLFYLFDFNQVITYLTCYQ